ncbi:MAG: nicotinamide mononucleotide transporter [Clostridia bacterium]|nr:nicotinamide mononucleotide transporter [Clostridia bacterium]
MRTPFHDLSKFERFLWGISLLGIVASFVLSGGGDWLSAIASLIGVTALIFVAKGYVLGQVLTVVFAVFYGIISFYFGYYGEMLTYLCMTAPIAVAAIVSWLRHPYKGTKEVEVGDLKPGTVVYLFLLAVVVTFAFYWILKWIHTTNLIISTLSVTTSFLAVGLTVLRSPYYALAYGANDIVLIVLWVFATLENISYLPMVFCFVMFLANDLYGFFNWQRMRKGQRKTVR